MNPVLRADVRYRLGSPKALAVHTIFLVVVALLTFLSLPPELGRLDELRQEGLLLAFLVVSTVLTMYFTSACACGEIGIEGEKSVWDLAASTFPAGTIAAGKVLSSASFAVLQWALAGPFIAVVAGIRGEPLAVFLRAALVGIPAATAIGAAGTLYSAEFESDFARSFAHWATLLAVVVGANALPAPWHALSPVRALAVVVREGARPVVWLVASAYAIAAIVCVGLVRRRVERMGLEARTP